MGGGKPTGREEIRQAIRLRLHRRPMLHSALCEALRRDPKAVMDELQAMAREGLVEQVGAGGSWRLLAPISASPREQPRNPTTITAPASLTTEDVIALSADVLRLRAQREAALAEHETRIGAASRDLESAKGMLREADAKLEGLRRERSTVAKPWDEEIAAIMDALRSAIGE